MITTIFLVGRPYNIAYMMNTMCTQHYNSPLHFLSIPCSSKNASGSKSGLPSRSQLIWISFCNQFNARNPDELQQELSSGNHNTSRWKSAMKLQLSRRRTQNIIPLFRNRCVHLEFNVELDHRVWKHLTKVNYSVAMPTECRMLSLSHQYVQ